MKPLTPSALRDMLNRDDAPNTLNTLRVRDMLKVPELPLPDDEFFFLNDKNGEPVTCNGIVVWFCKCGDKVEIANKKELGLE